MTDTALSEKRASIRAQVEKRLAARYRAERRFKFYGVAAVTIAGLALALLVISISITGVPALMTHEVTLDVAVPERVDLERTGDPAVIRRSNFTGMLQASLRTSFPEVRDRRSLRDLFGLVTSINASTLMNRVIDDPTLVGTTVPFTMPISDDVDLYFKGRVTGRDRRRGGGSATPSAQSGDVEITSDADDFAPVLDRVRALLLTRAETAQVEADRLTALVTGELNETTVAALVTQANVYSARAAGLRAAADAGQPTMALSSTEPSVLVRINGGVVKVVSVSARVVTGRVLVALESVATAAPRAWSIDLLTTPEADRKVKDNQIAWAEELRARGQVRYVFNGYLFTRADSREPELAGMKGSFIGSIFTMLVTMLLAGPIGVATAIYMEEFAPKNRWTDFIEVNINNLAAVPSIVFGLLGLAVFINFFGLPRSAPLIGGMVLALMALPTVIISTRAALKAVPPSIRSGALAVGASKVQMVFHHVAPLALPGILTGSIIALAQALGETAPLLMIGMVAFVADAPTGLTSPATVMPVQIFLWSDSAERAFEARTAALIMSLLGLMVFLNLIAVVLRRRFERRW